MQYRVIVEQKNGVWRAVIPALALSAEGVSYDEALHKAKLAAEAFMSYARIATIEIDLPDEQMAMRRGSPQSVLKAAGKFKGDEEAMLRHIEEIYFERKRQREKAELQRLSVE
jgi:hypothetical protein